MKPILDQARELAAARLTAGTMLTDEQAYTVPALFMPWSATATYAAGDRVRKDGLLYRCLQAHTAQADWTPGAAVSLWVRIDDPAEEWPAWRQPTGATDAYALGAKVSHNNARWVSAVSGNVWEPGVYGWTEQP
ncbi:MAG: carbohydrate-binding protein [Bacillota bacterium]